MIKCKYCGSENPDDTSFCMNCGAAIIPEDESRVETETTREGETILEAYQPEMNYTSATPSEKPDYQTVCLLALIFGIVGFIFNPLYLVSLAALILGIIGHVNMGTKKNYAMIGWILAIVSFVFSLIIDIFCTMGFGVFC